VYCVSADPVTRASDLMRAHDVGFLPVVDAAGSGRLVGIVTDRDLVLKIVAGNWTVASATVRDAMTANAWSCRTDDDLSRAIALMADKGIRRMPIVDGDGRLVGIIATGDAGATDDGYTG
jgi:CBS domain-containing protein